MAEHEECPVVLMQSVPLLKYHEAPVRFVSESGVTQKEYEEMVWNRSLPACDDDTITIKCRENQTGASRTFTIQRSSMRRCPAFIEFFRSEHYLHGCKMLLTFFDDPAGCFQILKCYLDDGPDCYTKTRLRVHVTLRYKVTERFIILGRLYMLAKKLALGGLVDMAYETIVDCEQSLTPTSCFAMASLVYGPDASAFDQPLKDWCLKHIENHFFALNDNENWWAEMMGPLEPNLGRHWADLVKANGSSVSASEDQDDQSLLEGIIYDMGSSGRAGIISVIEERSYANDVQRVLEEVWAEENSVSDDEWEKVEHEASEPGSPETTAAVVSNIGKDMMKGSENVKALGLLFKNDSAKARSVMGMDVIPVQLRSGTKGRFRGGRLLRLLRHC